MSEQKEIKMNEITIPKGEKYCKLEVDGKLMARTCVFLNDLEMFCHLFQEDLECDIDFYFRCDQCKQKQKVGIVYE